MRALFCGLGSIGVRHLKNLAAECRARSAELEVWALRSSARPLAAEAAPLVRREVARLPEGEAFDLAFITGPTHLHAAAISALKGRVGCFFIEKPIFEAPSHELAALGLGAGQRAYVAAPMRWTRLYAALKERLAERQVYSARVICSSYLPSWRPGADYREVYSAKKAMGGGVTLDLIHEWDYLAGLFGLPQAVYNLRGTFSHLEVDSDDLSVYIARYPGFLAELHLDYFGREYRRAAEFFCEDGTVVADFGAGTLALPRAGQAAEVLHFEEPPNARYAREMAWFLDYAQGAGESANSPAHALDVLKIALGSDVPK